MGGTKKLIGQKRLHSHQRVGVSTEGNFSGKEEGPKVENLAAENILDTVLGSAGWEGRPHGRGVGGGTLTAEKQSDRPGEAGGSHRSARTWGPTSKPSSFPHSPGKGEGTRRSTCQCFQALQARLRDEKAVWPTPSRCNYFLHCRTASTAMLPPGTPTALQMGFKSKVYKVHLFPWVEQSSHVLCRPCPPNFLEIGKEKS